MRHLYLIRHAKSSWKDPGLSDRMRPLKKRGRSDCALMAAGIRALNLRFDAVFCSPARRAQETFQHLNAEDFAPFSLSQTDESLYTFSTGSLEQRCRQLDPEHAHVLLIGHNPAMLGCINSWCDQNLMNFPTCGFAAMQLSGAWDDIGPSKALLLHLMTPRQFK